ncbi:MAG TPA: hypothetical protein VLF66_11400 [Thermoanaerobaculia bacterium]|nr:hypothetical protein [Thermoanaerobaculia bacterium]
MWLLILAFIGLVGPNGLFLYWLFYEYPGVSAVLENHLAVAFMIDAFMALGLLSYVFATRPIGRVRWPWFVVLSLVGGLGFSIPFYIWLNRRPANRLEAAS